MTRVGRKFNRFGRFSLVGLMGAVLQLTLASLLTRYFGGLSAAATLVAVEITVLHNFVWHERFTWRNQGPKNSRQLALRLWRFHAGNGVVSLAGNTILMYGLVERLKAPVLPTAIGAIVVCSLANFLVADRWRGNRWRCGNPREAKHVVDLVGKVRPARRHHCHIGRRLLRHDLRGRLASAT